MYFVYNIGLSVFVSMFLAYTLIAYTFCHFFIGQRFFFLKIDLLLAPVTGCDFFVQIFADIKIKILFFKQN